MGTDRPLLTKPQFAEGAGPRARFRQVFAALHRQLGEVRLAGAVMERARRYGL